ncbi:MAG: hypothetical protein FWG51_06220 [Firmicutes bacterium]|nr:hypothetical protein [Bacillota bacterium]
MKSNVELNRLKSMIICDKINIPNELCSLIKSDVYIMLSNYLDLIPDNVTVDQSIEDSGFIIQIKAKTNRIKPFGNLPK